MDYEVKPEDRKPRQRARKTQADAAWYQDQAQQFEKVISETRGVTKEDVASRDMAIKAREKALEHAKIAEEPKKELSLADKCEIPSSNAFSKKPVEKATEKPVGSSTKKALPRGKIETTDS
jgi:hypothetical protein